MTGTDAAPAAEVVKVSTHLGATSLMETVLDTGSFISWDEPAGIPDDITPKYREDLARARATSGVDESVLTGRGSIEGIAVAVIVSEFGFLGGSVGVACANRIETAVRRATAEGLPLLAAPASGGTRMQEGTIAFVQMIRITAAIVDHREAGLAYLVYLRHPTTGGVFASWGLLGHITVAEPGALLGFLGPKVYKSIHGVDFPDGVQTAENLAAHGLIDAVLAPTRLARLAGRVLRVMRQATVGVAPAPEAEAVAASSTWESILQTRDPKRPGVRDLLRHAATDVVQLFGTAEGEKEPGLILALATIRGASCVVIGQDRLGQQLYGPIGPAGLRQVRRGIRVAAELKLPVVAFIDTPGASLSREAEEGGLATTIARCLVDMLVVPSPTVAVLLGEGAGGAALALLPCDRLIAAEHAWLSSLPPEGASAIVHHGDVSFAPVLAETQGVSARQLAARGIVDVIVPEGSGDTIGYLQRLGDAISREVARAAALPTSERIPARSERYTNSMHGIVRQHEGVDPAYRVEASA